MLYEVITALMIGGLIAAPIAAWLVRIVHPQLMGVLVGGFIILVNARTLLNTWVEDTSSYPYLYAVIAAIWIGAIFVTIKKIAQISSNKLVDLES